MDPREQAFMQAVIGASGASALARAADRSPELGSALVPRVIMAWLGVAAPAGYEGEVPGAAGTVVNFKKSEKGYGGHLSIGAETYRFQDASVFQLAGAVAVAIGSDVKVDPALKDLDIARLGKSIDTLVKARVLVEEMRRRRTAKTEVPGQAAGALAPEAPAAPTPTSPRPTAGTPKTKAKLPRSTPGVKPPAAPKVIKVEKSLADHARCSACGGSLFKAVSSDVQEPRSYHTVFIGCPCFSEAADAVKVLAKGESLTIELAPEKWDDDAIAALVGSLGAR